MKKLIAGLTILISTSTFAQQYFRLSANCYINGGRSASCQVCNNTGYRIRCNVNSRGLTYRGFWVTNRGSLTILPGQCANSWVRANNPTLDPLVDANASAQCRF